LRSGGDLVCWGHGGFGQLGDGGRLDRPVPVPVSSLTTVVAVAAGEGHTCARTAERRIWCWGRNTFGQLGDGTTDDRLVPTLVAAVDDVVEVVAGRDHTCARRGDGEVLCWGAGFEGQLGDGERHLPDGFRPQPRPVAGLGVVEALMAGTGHVCARRADTTLACWGDNGAGQLGVGRTIRREPFAVPRTEGAVVVVTGGYFLCGLYGADARCWGANAFGQLGDGAREPRSIPAPVRDLGPARVIGAGARHACAVSAAGDGVWCWGANHRGQAGRAPTPRRLVPGRVEGT
jgi:alpha-tubulin suppressor-like RCC1 family protein